MAREPVRRMHLVKRQVLADPTWDLNRFSYLFVREADPRAESGGSERRPGSLRQRYRRKTRGELPDAIAFAKRFVDGIQTTPWNRACAPHRIVESATDDRRVRMVSSPHCGPRLPTPLERNPWSDLSSKP